MPLPRFAFVAILCLAAILPAQAGPQRNVVIFVADGLRYSSVTPETAPTMTKVRQNGVDFSNSHAVYPTLTTANASAIATGHFLGDTGDYANTLYLGFPIQCRLGPAVKLTFLEDDCILRAVKNHFGDGYMGQTTLMQAARAAGYDTILVGKKGPLAIQWLAALDSQNDDIDGPLGIFIDESTNHPKNLDGSSTMSTMLRDQIASDAFSATGVGAPPFTSVPNLTQQAYLLSVTTQTLIPDLKSSGKPFAMLFWSRDPDTTQHGATDSEGKLIPGINSTDARAAIYNADSDLKGILDALKQWGLADNTDVFVIADHGFSTIAKATPTPDGTLGRNTLATGFVALDVARWLGNLNIYDPDQENQQLVLDNGMRPQFGDAFIGPSVDHPMAIVAANGGSDFIYVPDGADKRATAKRIFDRLIEQPYVGALFVNDALLKNGNPKDFAGALPMSAVNLIGHATVPQPDIVIGFRSFVVKGCKLGAQMCTAEIADTNLQTGQGMHGSPSRTDTRNFMAAIGPDFKAGFNDTAPVGNVDVTPTMAHILGVDLTGPGTLKGRVIAEALKGGKMPKVTRWRVVSPAAVNGFHTVLDVQEVGSTRYFDAAGMPGRIVGLPQR
ncbi:MAG: alkaline phosphatase family protein [Alphaproteobacteria bacterium]|nr:alkaline phosphatase family protein [Alphaproteobacteria bacterium]